MVDCSVMPTLVSGNTNAPAMMIGGESGRHDPEDAADQQAEREETCHDKAYSETGSRSRRVVTASLIGATIEWYDFFLYGVVAGIVFNKLYLPDRRSARLDPARLRHLRRRLRRAGRSAA